MAKITLSARIVSTELKTKIFGAVAKALDFFESTAAGSIGQSIEAVMIAPYGAAVLQVTIIMHLKYSIVGTELKLDPSCNILCEGPDLDRRVKAAMGIALLSKLGLINDSLQEHASRIREVMASLGQMFP